MSLILPQLGCRSAGAGGVTVTQISHGAMTDIGGSLWTYGSSDLTTTAGDTFFLFFGEDNATVDSASYATAGSATIDYWDSNNTQTVAIIWISGTVTNDTLTVDFGSGPTGDYYGYFFQVEGLTRTGVPTGFQTNEGGSNTTFDIDTTSGTPELDISSNVLGFVWAIDRNSNGITWGIASGDFTEFTGSPATRAAYNGAAGFFTGDIGENLDFTLGSSGFGKIAAVTYDGT